MKSMWRISAHRELDGLGGERSDGRWHTAGPGKRIVYLSEHPAVSLVETIVNLRGEPRFYPTTYQLLKLNVAEDVAIETLDPKLLAIAWREDVQTTRALGDGWLAAGASAILAVPSAPSPESRNYLLSPRHPAVRLGVTIAWEKKLVHDKRLFMAQ